MHSSLRQKACLACSISKRGCDKQLPECQRCLDRHLDCVYPQSKRRFKDHTPADTSEAPFFPPEYFMSVNPLGDSFDPEAWGIVGAPNLEAVLSDPSFPFLQTPAASTNAPSINAPENHVSTETVVHERSEPPGTPASTAWYLQEETWEIRQVEQDTDCVVDIGHELKAYIRSVAEMLQSWVKNGHNSFIHRRLYEKGMPVCLQDAFTTLATYNSRTPAVEEVTLRIAETRLAALTSQSPPSGSGSECILAHLARIQSLFVYEFIMLFDGSVRVRAAAEKQLPALRQWLFQLWETVKDYRGEEGPLYNTQLVKNDFDREYGACTESWRLWVLTESVRRTHMVIESVTNVFEAMTRGWAECVGGPMVTARSGLWEAESAMDWCELCDAKSPILVPSLRPAPVISEYEAEEVDELIKLVWAVIVGSDRIRFWTARKKRVKYK